jgi:hypothetical protein
MLFGPRWQVAQKRNRTDLDQRLASLVLTMLVFLAVRPSARCAILACHRRNQEDDARKLAQEWFTPQT